MGYASYTHWVARSGFYAKWDVTYTGEMFADNGNQTRVDPFTVSNLRFGHNAMYDNWELVSFLGINNLFDESFNDNIRINAFGGRYFEPAAERNAYIGLTLRRSFLP